jgi:hypothetical protein
VANRERIESSVDILFVDCCLLFVVWRQ